jgi:hypothetical protein
MKTKVTSHLEEANKNYFEHLSGAFLTTRQCFAAGTAALIHGIFPFLFETTASDTIRVIYRRQNPEKRSDV